MAPGSVNPVWLLAQLLPQPLDPAVQRWLDDAEAYCDELVDSEGNPVSNYRIGAEGTVTPPADMMAAAKASLSETGFANLMERTGGRAPTPAELVEFADNERAAGIAPPYEQQVNGSVNAHLPGATAAMIGSNTPS